MGDSRGGRELFADEGIGGGFGQGLGERPVDGDGEPAWLRRACISRNAATDIRCDESERPVSARGRGLTGGVCRPSETLERLLLGAGLDGPTCRNDLRLNEESSVAIGASFFGSGGCSFDGDFDHANKERLGEGAGGEGAWLGKERVESALFGSVYAAKIADFEGGGRRRRGSSLVLDLLLKKGGRGDFEFTESVSSLTIDFLRPKRRIFAGEVGGRWLFLAESG